MIIPLQGGAQNAHQKFDVQLGENLVNFTINYTTLSDQWSVDLRIDNNLVAAGLMLEPNADILSGYQLDIGHLVFVGDLATLDNLGSANFLHWIEQT
jgi:hypothetical protein